MFFFSKEMIWIQAFIVLNYASSKRKPIDITFENIVTKDRVKKYFRYSFLNENLRYIYSHSRWKPRFKLYKVLWQKIEGIFLSLLVLSKAWNKFTITCLRKKIENKRFATKSKWQTQMRYEKPHLENLHNQQQHAFHLALNFVCFCFFPLSFRFRFVFFSMCDKKTRNRIPHIKQWIYNSFPFECGEWPQHIKHCTINI